MIYTIAFTIPFSTSEAFPHHESLIVCRGLIYRVEFQFPPGCAGLAHVVMCDGGHQMYPSSLGQWFCTDSTVIGFDDTFLKLAAPYQFDLYGYNEDETYDHTVYVRVGMVDKEIFMARFLPSYGYAELVKVIEEQQKVQEAERAAVLTEPFPWLRRE
jgi:hypothetical protein